MPNDFLVIWAQEQPNRIHPSLSQMVEWDFYTAALTDYYAPLKLCGPHGTVPIVPVSLDENSLEIHGLCVTVYYQWKKKKDRLDIS